MELSVVKTTELTNKELTKSLNTVNTLVSDMKANQKLIAFNIGTIVNEELWADDFEDSKAFCKYLNISKASASQFKKFATVVEVGVINSDFSYTQITETYPLLDLMDKITTNALADLEITSDMSCKEIRKKVNAIIEAQIVDEPTDGEASEESEAGEETNEETTESNIEYLVNYLENLEVGIELDKEDMKVFKQIVRELKKHE